MFSFRSCAMAIAIMSLTACGERPPAVNSPIQGGVSAASLIAADSANWLSYGRSYDEQRFSPLEAIDRNNIDALGLAWYFDVPTSRGMEATPIVVDGRMYVSGSWSIVYALDAASGELLWRYDPEVPKSWAQYACCDVVNRGVAVWGNAVFVGTLDGYLVALDQQSGEELWRVDTIDRKPPYSITGAPRVVNGLVLIGNGGADLGVRGYISAYDADDGDLVWRFYTVPGNPKDGFESAALEMAAGTWTGQWWRYGGGGTVWDSMAYDPDLDLLYFGVGNGSPWNQQIRSPEGGDNLFLASIVAVRPSTGEYVWHYQTTPGETWDYTATQSLILADLEIDGERRKVLMQAPKNGFFYVLDRVTGEFISAEPFVNVTWAERIDADTGRPVEVPAARYKDGPALVMPSGFGGHNWHPMAFSPETELVYLPAQDIPGPYMTEADFTHTDGVWNTGVDLELLQLPDDPAVVAEIMKSMSGQLLAWDPVSQSEVWRYQHAGPWNGGVLATAGDLVFQGSLIGEFAAYDAGTGKRLWQFDVQTGVAAAPMTYLANDEQHVAVAAGWGTVFGLVAGEGVASMGLKNVSRILAFKSGGEAALPPPAAAEVAQIPQPPASDATEPELAVGQDIYYERCAMCHGLDVASGGVLPDLRYLTREKHAIWDAIVLGGSLRDNGMPAFGQIISKVESDAVQAFVISRAARAYARTAATDKAVE
ncbi:MAG: PQQ-dependent dehydrogenase, methanol/ethanol family [Gammaproteobacteria bacterium]|nr:PQQ-dependent dehydrogenase, methanol/ethanol family [Gammaproteobacteria bacterium]